MSRGFITLAQNSATGDYVRAAYGLALSLKRTQTGPNKLSIMITPGTIIPDRYVDAFDQIIDIPWSDMARDAEWKIHNKWKVYHCSPYEETILMDADMLMPMDIHGWWSILSRRDVYACVRPYTFRGDPIRSSIYREAFDLTGLPHVYTAFLYYRKNPAVQRYFWFVEQAYKNWEKMRQQFPGLPVRISGDLAFAVGMRLADRVREYSGAEFPGIVHMKTSLQDIGAQVLEDWTQHLPVQVRADGSIHVGGYRQLLPFHYHVKTFLNEDILSRLE